MYPADSASFSSSSKLDFSVFSRRWTMIAFVPSAPPNFSLSL